MDQPAQGSGSFLIRPVRPGKGERFGQRTVAALAPGYRLPCVDRQTCRYVAGFPPRSELVRVGLLLRSAASLWIISPLAQKVQRRSRIWVRRSFDEHWETASTPCLYRLGGRLSTGNRAAVLAIGSAMLGRLGSDASRVGLCTRGSALAKSIAGVHVSLLSHVESREREHSPCRQAGDTPRRQSLQEANMRAP